MEEKVWKVDLKKPIEEFSRHLEPEDNIHILFSGEFGIGKTYFLDNFFSSNKDKYLAVRLNPVNYSISTNEDIFRLIKYDIVYELLVTHQYKFNKVEFDKGLAISTVIFNKLNSKPIPAVLSNLLKLLGPLNKDQAEFVTPILDSFTAFTDLAPGINSINKEAEGLKENLDLKQIKLFLEETHKQPELELDFVTEFIQDALKKLSLTNLHEGTQPKCNILIIDDLDRIDPEHTFRLFNIFSAHLGYKKTALNKFGFDKAVFVCDILNIRNIFHAKYGTNTDFSGYIDKFYSSEIFHFDNTKAIIKQIEDLLDSIKISSQHNANEQNNIKKIVFSNTPYVLKDMINANAIKIRSLEKIFNKIYPFESNRELFKSIGREVTNWQLPIIMLFKQLEWILGKDTLKVKRAINQVKRYATKPTIIISSGDTIHHESISYSYLVGIPLLYVAHAQHEFKVKQAGEPPYEYNQHGFEIKYSIRQEFSSRVWYAELSAPIAGPEYKSDIHTLYSLLELAYQMYTNQE